MSLIALGVAGGVAAERLSHARPPMGISQQQFHDNCLGQEGQYGALNGEVVCTLDGTVQVICQFDTALGGCLWTGPIKPGRLLAILGGPVA